LILPTNKLSNKPTKPNKGAPRRIRRRLAQNQRALIAPQPYSDRVRSRHAYSTIGSLGSGAAGVVGTETIFRLNSMYDPEFGVGGHQPYGRDQMAAIYNRYKVWKCDVEITVHFANTATSFFAMKWSGPSDTTALTGMDYTCKERANVQTWPLSTLASKPLVIRRSFDLPRLLVLTPAAFRASYEVSAGVGANVQTSSEAYLRIAQGSLAGSAGETCGYQITLIYYCEWSERIDFGPS